MDFLSIIVPPIIGAVIGYVTNWIAVKMLFRPLKPVKIGKFKLPFTPGLIPKSKPRLAKALGSAVSTNLLSNDDFIKALTSDEVVDKLNKNIAEYMHSDTCLKDIVISNSSLDDYNNILSFSSDKISSVVLTKLEEKNVGHIISAEIQKIASEKMKGSLLGIFGGNSIVSSLGEPVESAINTYISDNGKSIIDSMVSDELSSLGSKKFSDVSTFDTINFSDMITKIYINFVTSKVPVLLDTINISSIIENKILEMDLLDLENLILSVMKNELKALVNLGALIGFVLGLVNIFF